MVAMVDSLKSRPMKICPTPWPKLCCTWLAGAYVRSLLQWIYWMSITSVNNVNTTDFLAFVKLGCHHCHASIWHVFPSTLTTRQLCACYCISHWETERWTYRRGRCPKTAATMDGGAALGSTVSARESAKAGTGGRGPVATAPAPRMEEAKARMHP